MKSPITLRELANQINAELHGDPSCEISRVSTLQNAEEGCISFLSNRRYRRYLRGTKASAVILSIRDLDECRVFALVTNEPYLGYARIAALLNPRPDHLPGIHPQAVIEDNTTIPQSACIGPLAVISENTILGENVIIGSGCVVGRNVRIGDNTELKANVTICDGSILGSQVLIHPGVVIGADGFGIAKNASCWIKIPQLGNVIIGNDVEIGANTAIDRGALEDTVIGNGVKLDNHIQIGHNSRIGDHSVIAGCVGISGSVTIGQRCEIGGQVGIAGHITIVDDVCITGGSVVYRSVKKPGVYSSGMPLQDNALWHKNYYRYKQIDAMAKKIKAIEDLSKPDHQTKDIK